MENTLTNYDIESLLYKAAGFDEFVHWLMNELDATEDMKSREKSELNFIELNGEIRALKKVKDVYCYFKKNGKLPDNTVTELKIDSEF